VQYIEKTYAAHKFPSGFIKREQRPGEFEQLTSRMIDRSIRVLFPKGYRYNTVVNIMVLSSDYESDLQVLALNAASAVLYNSNIPINTIISAVRVGKIDNEIIINPTKKQKELSLIDAFISGTSEQILMIEMKSNSNDSNGNNEIKEDELLEIIDVASGAIKESVAKYNTSFSTHTKEEINLEYIVKDNSDLASVLKNDYLDKLKALIKIMAKTERDQLIRNLAKEINKSDYDNSNYENIYKALLTIKRELIRNDILNSNIRPDGRGLEDVREISIQTNLLPNAHGSCLFTRGQTQALCIATIGSDKDGQIYDNLSEGSQTDHFTLHYNFPGFSVGEASIVSAPGRRELGHGNLAKKALQCTLSMEDKTSIRVVSEILASNGSSSMATVCGGSLALKTIRANISKLSAGVAMGLIVSDDKEAILSDITGLEDHEGDMDFKIVGTKDGITALQLDIKISGLSLELLSRVFTQAKKSRLHILDIMEKASENIIYNDDLLPSSNTIHIDPSKTMLIIGKAGSTIKELTSEFKVSVDINRDNGEVKVSGDSMDNVQNACKKIETIAGGASSAPIEKINFLEKYDLDEVVRGVVKRIVDFGAFIELQRGGEGLLHISKISRERIDSVKDVLDIDETLEVRVIKISKDRIELQKV
jgi:polyribonucleotide nucleotidyltransferase